MPAIAAGAVLVVVVFIGFSGGVDVVGAVFAKELAVSGSLVVDYRGATPPAANVCTPEPTPAGASGSPALK